MPIFQSLHCNLVGKSPHLYPHIGCFNLIICILLLDIETDANGIVSSSLRSKLQNWPADKARPKVLYTVPVRHFTDHAITIDLTGLQYGCNPTGATATLERRKEVIQLAYEYDFIILEGWHSLILQPSV